MNFLSLANKAKTIPPLSANLIDSRYSWLSLELAEPSLGVPPNISLISSLTSTVWVLSSDIYGDRGWCKMDATSMPLGSPERPDLGTIGDAINELIYVFPSILTFHMNGSASPGFAEFGTTLTPASLSWSSNKKDQRSIISWYLNVSGANATFSQWITGDTNFRSYDLGSLSGGFNETLSFYLTAIDWAGNKAMATYNMKFVIPTYIGTATTDIMTSAVVLGGIYKIALTDYLKGTFDIPTAGGKRFYIAFPPGSTIPTFKFGIYTYIPETTLNINISSSIGVEKPYTIKYSDTGYVQNTLLTLQ